MKKKICFVALSAYPLFNNQCKKTFGGAEVQFYLISKKIAKNKNIDVNFVVADFRQKKIEEYNNVKIWKSASLKKSITNYVKGPIILYKTLKKIDPDMVIQRNAGAETFICALFCKINKKKFIYSVSSDIDVNGTFKRRKIIGNLFYWGLKNANKIILQNNSQNKELRKDKRLKKIPKKIIKNSFPIGKKKRKQGEYILWVGRSNSYKRPEIFLRLAKELPKEKFIMIMPQGSDKKRWDGIVQEIKKIKNLRFIEKVKFNKIDKYFEEAKIFVNTSEFEGFPNTFIQSCINSVPIISLKVNPGNFLKKENCGFSCNDNFENMIEKVKTLIKNKKIYCSMSKNAVDYALKNHNIKKAVKLWEKEITH